MSPAAFTAAAHDELFRYLGILISSKPDQAEVWKTTLQQLTARLHLAAIKTTNVLQRVQVSRAVIIPKITFVARHYWPTREHMRMLQRFVHRYVWFGTTSPDLTTKKAWMSGDVAQQPHSEGGLEIPNVQTELLLLSARTVTRWMGVKTPTSVAVAAILLRAPRASTHLVHAPGRPDPAPLRLSATLPIHCSPLSYRSGVTPASAATASAGDCKGSRESGDHGTAEESRSRAP